MCVPSPISTHRRYYACLCAPKSACGTRPLLQVHAEGTGRAYQPVTCSAVRDRQDVRFRPSMAVLTRHGSRRDGDASFPDRPLWRLVLKLDACASIGLSALPPSRRRQAEFTPKRPAECFSGSVTHFL